jgi:GNAT superfamily N-acetyltransferase
MEKSFDELVNEYSSHVLQNSPYVGDAHTSPLDVDRTISSSRIAVVPHYLAMPTYDRPFIERPENNLWVPLKKIWDKRKGGDCYWYALRPAIAGMGGIVGNPIGMAFIRGWADNWDEKVFGVVVDQPWQGQGIGSLLLQTAIVEARLRNLPLLRLHVVPSNKKAIDLYTRLGFLHKGERDNGEWVMRKQL